MAAEIVNAGASSIASKVAESFYDVIRLEISYVFKYKRYVEKLRSQVEVLKSKKEKMEQLIKRARRQGDEVYKSDEEWPVKVIEFIKRVEKSIDEEEEKAHKKQCLKGLCPNLMTRYNLSKEAVKASEEVVDLLKEVADFKFDSVSYQPSPERRELLNDIEGCQQFDSRKKIFWDVINELKESKFNRIGVYGMGGVGKTTLAKQVAKKVMEDKLFDEVVMAQVTQTPDVKAIQDKIAYDLGLVFDQNLNSFEKSGKLRKRLLKVESERLKKEENESSKKEKKVLVILDNVWGKFDLEEVGIPTGIDKGGRCTILLTSRLLDVLCNEMNSQKNFSIDVLSHEESMDLFWKSVGDLSKETFDFQSLAVEIVRKLGGLPIAIKTVANALKEKPTDNWKNALNRLKKSNVRPIQGMDAEVYSSIKLSYDFLQNEEAKSLFLLCALQKDGSRIPINDMMMYGMGLSLFMNVYTMEEGRNMVHELINTLKSSCLLLDGDTEDEVKMHDIVHAVAVSIATDKLMLNIRNVADLKGEPENGIQGDAAAIYLPYTDIQQLPERLKCPKLKLFLLFAKHETSLQIPDHFFEGMKELRVLHMSEICLLSLPSSLSCLVNLRTLILINCYSLKDVAILGQLKKLEILSFRESDIEELPVEIGQLTQLRMLDLGTCSSLTLIAPNVISKLSQLEELYMGYSFTQWGKVQGQTNNASLVELKKLSNLKALEIQIPDMKVMPRELFFVELERYKISIGFQVYPWHSFNKYGTPRSLKLKINESIYLESGIQVWVKRCEDLYVDELNGFQSVLPNLDGEGFPRLKHLFVQNSPEILYIVNSVRQIHFNAFPLLESLFLGDLRNLEKICQGRLIENQSFSNLRIIKVKRCHSLKHLFSFSMAKNFLQLQEIQVRNCDYLRMIVGKESETHTDHESESFSEINFTQLRSLRLERIPQLTSCGLDSERPLVISRTTLASREIVAEDDVKTLFNNKVIFPNVEKMELKGINIEKIWLDQSTAMPSCSKYLTKLTVENCHNLKSLFSPSMVNSFVQLQELDVRNCESIEGVIDIRLLKTEEEMIEMVFPKLICLRLDYLPKLSTFGVGNSIAFPSLLELLIKDCNNMERFTSSSILARGTSVEENIHTDKQLALFDEKIKLPSLEILRFKNMGLNKIWHHELALDSFSKLRDLRLAYCGRLKNIFPSNMYRRLERLGCLEVEWCHQLEEIIEISSCNGKEVPNPRFVFPRLTSFKLINLSSLKTFYPGMHVSEFPVLEELDIDKCNQVETLASEIPRQGKNQHEMAIQQQPFFMVEEAGLSTLKKLRISVMDKLKIWHNMEVASESDTVGALRNLEELVVSFCQFEDINELIETATQLKILKLEWLDNVKQVWPMKVQGSRFQTFQNLISIEVSNLGSMKTLFPATVAKGLLRLENLMIFGLYSLEEVVTKEEGVDEAFPSDMVAFPRLISLRLENLSRLKSFCKGMHISDWPMLKKLHVRDCKAVIILASSEIMSEESQQPLFLVDHEVAFPSLEELELYGLDNLLHLWKENSLPCNVFHNLKTLDVFDCDELRNLVTVSSNLATVKVKSCNKLRNLMTLSTTQSKVNLKSVTIWGCEMLENIIELQVGEQVKEDHIVFNQLESLVLYHLPRLRSFCSGNYSILEFPYLTKVNVYACPSMKIFSKGILHTPKLHKEQYKYRKEEVCWEGDLNSSIQKMFEDMVGYVGTNSLKLSEFPQVKEKWHSQTLPVSNFSNLQSLAVDDCTSMLSAIPANLLGFLNKLETLEVRNCDLVEEVFHLEEVNANGHFGTLFPQLQRLELLNLPKLKRFCNFIKDIIELPRLSHLLIENCPNMETFIFDSTQGDITTNKEPQEMTLESKEINILADIQSLFDEKVASLHLKELKLSKLPKLLHLWKENSHPSNLFQNLEILEVSECHKLEKLVPSSVSLKNLRTLKASKCDGLINLVTLSTAKSLVDLIDMNITDCKMMEEIIELQVGEEVKEDPIVFSQLKYLGLDHLPSLARFHWGNYTLEFPYLEKLIVRECPKMKIFSKGTLSTPKLQRLYLAKLENEECWDGDLNSTIQKLFEEMNVQDIKEEDMSMELILDIQ